ncbi:MAG: ABC transporter substrate-binding protein [SAR202 cluster bacterium]|nr:ABC transporter substrate-binding protein [SAR202 cluster bacterium]
MKGIKAAFFLALASLVLVAIGCGESEPAPTAVPPTATPTEVAATPTSTPVPSPTAIPDFPLTLMDSNGKEVVFDSPPERIIAYDSAVVEILFAIGEGERVIGTHDFVTYPPEAADVPRLGGAFNIDIEAAVAMEPDLVFIFAPTFLEQLGNVGLKVLYLESLQADFIKVADTIRLWGRIVGNQEGAETAAVEFESRVQKVIETMSGADEGPNVFQDEGDLWTPGPDTLIAEVFEVLKMQNIAHDISGYAQLSPEIIVERDPQVIIASYGDNISGAPAFADLSAVKNGRIFIPSSDALSIAGPRFVAGIEELAKWVYPDLFD